MFGRVLNMSLLRTHLKNFFKTAFHEGNKKLDFYSITGEGAPRSF